MLGSIHSVTLKNFMVYNHIVFKPSPGLNLVIGSNGSGKSSILIAIIIGLGGQLEDIGRQKSLGNFVKEDSNSAAEIDIALEWDSSTKKVIKAVIERNAQEPKYYVDSKPFSRKMVAELAKGANINPGNMCQFLPQEKVSHFSRMDHKVLFMNVLKAIGEERALQAYHDLDKLTERHKEASEKLQSQDEKIARKTAEVASLEHVSDNIKEREAAGKKKKALDALLKICQLKRFESQQLACQANKSTMTEALDKATTEKKRLDEEGINRQAMQQELSKKLRKLQTETYDVTHEARKSRKAEQDTLCRLQQNIENESGSLLSIKRSLSQARKDLEEYSSKNGALDEQNRKLQNAARELESLEQRVNSKQLNHNLNERSLASAQNQIIELERRIQTNEHERMNRLAQLHPDTFRAVHWIRANKDKFKNPDGVFEPLLFQLDVQDIQGKSYAKYLERVIGGMKAHLLFICEDVDDSVLLMKERKKQGFRISVKHSEVTIQAFDNQINNGYFFLSDLIGPKCPPAVVSYLRKDLKLDKIPVFTNPRSPIIATYDKDGKKHFVRDEFFSYVRSNYSAGHTTRVDTLPKDEGPKFLVQTPTSDTDNPDKKLLESRKQQVLQMEAQIREYKKLKQDLEIKRRARRQIQEILNVHESKLQKVSGLEKTINSFQSNNGGANKELREYLSKYHEKCLAVVKMLENLMGLEVEAKLVEADLEAIKNSGDKEFLDEQEKAHQTYETALNQLKANLENHRKAQERLRQNQLYLWEHHKPWADKKFKSFKDFFDSIPDRILDVLENITENNFAFNRNMPPTELPNVKVIDDALNGWKQICETKLQNRNIAEEQRLSDTKIQLENLKKLEEILERDKKKAEDKLEACRNVIATQKSRFERLSDKFSQLMERLGFAGQLYMVATEKPSCPYRMEVKVKFREQSDFSILHGSTQSGGEKAISTAAFVLALQSFEEDMCMPFCCVDEINAGMDEHNEMMVWRLILSSQTSKRRDRDQGQMFYFSPTFSEKMKLVDMDDNAPLNVSVHICSRGDIQKRTSGNRGVNTKPSAPSSIKKILNSAKKNSAMHQHL